MNYKMINSRASTVLP